MTMPADRPSDAAAPSSRPVPSRPSDELPPGERAPTLFLVAVTALSAAADLSTKAWAHAQLAGFDYKRSTARTVTVIKDHVDFIFAQNPGGAWSFLRGLPEGLRRPFFLFVSVVAIVFIVSIYRRVHRDQTAMKWGLPLALGGAIGNLMDRIRYGWVIDFIDVYITRGGREHHWPTFNVADVAIVVGVALMGIDMFTSSRRAQRTSAPPAAPAPAAAPALPAEPPAPPG